MRTSLGMVSLLIDGGSSWGLRLFSRIAIGFEYLMPIAVVLSIPTPVAAQALPYIPTTILLPEPHTVPLQHNVTPDIAYILSPHDDSVDLLALNISASVQVSSVSLQPLSTGLPFLKDISTAFSVSLADNGSIVVYAGDCSSAKQSSIWTFDPSSTADSSVWFQQSIATATDVESNQTGPGFLGSSLSFSTTLEPEMSKASVYVYGGMCPNGSGDDGTPQSDATYSNQMLRIAPSDSETDDYVITEVASKGPPVPEAGFTLTGLYPSIANRSGVVTQQANYVLLGGHTRNAFINMSTVALWSLPEESWGFVSDISVVGVGTGNTELAIKSTYESIDSRSGHTAVLNEEGTVMVILGGWVGDLTQAASPQLAVLKIGAGYGGEDDWQWTVPETQPSGPGIYGHGAVLLPGNVMMVYGGYSISSSGSKAKRQTSGGGDGLMFLNLTSMTWTEDYTNPSYAAGSGEATVASADAEADRKKRLGFGLGLGLGLAATLGAILVYLWYRRRLRHKRMIRNSQLQALAQDNSHFITDGDEMAERDDGGVFPWYAGGRDAYGNESRTFGYESLRGSRRSMDGSHNAWIGGSQPQVRRKLMAPRAARGQYQPTPGGNYDPPSGPRGPGPMGPIYEADEEGPMHDGDIAAESPTLAHDAYRDSGHYSDPFASPPLERSTSFPTPSRSSLTPSPEHPCRTTDPEVQGWMTDIDAADALLSGLAPRPLATGTGTNQGQGPTTPTGRGGTAKSTRSFGGYFADDDSQAGSNISESNRSNLTPSRSGSARSALRTGFGVAAAAKAAAVIEGRGDTAGTSSSDSSAPSYNTARSSFQALQAEGPSLLLGGSSNRGDERAYEEEPPGSPSKSKPPRRSGWLGSLRRVFSGPTPSPSPTGSGNDASPRRESFAEGGSPDYETRLGGLGSIAAGGLLRRKGGRGAWESAGGGGEGSSSAFSQAGPGGDRAGEDDEWDIEKAIERRLVQVMFTVPKERLRVVNAGPEIDDALSGVLVNPEDDDDAEDGGALVVPRSREGPEAAAGQQHRSSSGGGGQARSSSPPALPEDTEERVLRRKGSEEEEEGGGVPAIREEEGAAGGRNEGRRQSDLSALEKEIELLGAELEAQRDQGRPSLTISEQHSEGHVFSAEAVQFERPRTRVLAMVESFESLGSHRSRSPSSSPTRSSPASTLRR
ncbi:hypothetical protein DL764_000762 [Monosporascus ibericus]|uniref:Uncharacterized protein n=1 Tax=Monosporascus ibericus TaxID=155417 RepID=A0A4Q4TX91_9PEZI|nr:hypothetical protein DL764_000762 [Monosporascus ibericus]